MAQSRLAVFIVALSCAIAGICVPGAALAHAESLAAAGRRGDLDACRELFRVEFDRQDLARAESTAANCVALSREIGSARDPGLASDLARLAQVLIARNELDQAASRLDEADSVLAKGARDGGTVRPDSTDATADLLDARGALARERGQLPQAAGFFTRALAAREARWGPDHPAITGSLEELGDAEQELGDLKTAEATHRRAIAIRERAVGADDAGLAYPLNNLGVVLRREGDLRGAVDCYRRSLALRTAARGKTDPEVALTMVNLSAPLAALGEHAEALRLLREAVGIMQQIYGPGHTRTAWALSHLAQQARDSGEPKEAEATFRRCLAISSASKAPETLDDAQYHLGIGQSLSDQGELREALVEFEAAAAIATRILGADNGETARYEREVGVTRILLGDLAGGQATLEACEKTLETRLGPEHPALVRCLSGLTVASLAGGRVAEARTRAERRLAIAEKAFGENGLRGALLMMTAVETAAGASDDAAGQALRAVRIAGEVQDAIFGISSEREAMLYAGHERRAVATLLAALDRAARDSSGHGLAEERMEEIFAVVAATHGRILDRLAERRRFFDLARDPASDALFTACARSADRLARRVLQGPGGKPDRYNAEITQAREAKESAERDLAAKSETFRAQVARRMNLAPPGAADLAKALPADACLVQFVRFPRFAIGTADWRPGASSLVATLFSGGGERYGAFRLRARAGGGREVRFTELGDAATIDSAIARYRAAVEMPSPDARPTAREEAAFRAASRRLYDLVWAPLIEDAPGGAAKAAVAPAVFLVPASQLSLVDFNTLLSSRGELVIERYEVVLLSSAPDLLRPPSASRGTGGARRRGLLAVGNPAGAPAGALCAEIGAPAPELPGAAREVDRVAELFERRTGEPATRLTGAAAGEARVKALMPRCRVLHLATHGFFCEELNTPETMAEEEIRKDPLVLCGLRLASDSSSEDGFLTAEEIAAMDLGGVEWAALSACRTGMGTSVPGEGLYGLRRAFELAGVPAVIMSLWRIGDTTAAELMAAFYERRLEGRPAPEALRLAELERLKTERRRFGCLHPAGWGGLVAEGEWR